MPSAHVHLSLTLCTANAVARVENLEFLTDVVPKTQTYKQVKQKQAGPSQSTKKRGPAQQTLDQTEGKSGENQATNGAPHDPESMDVDEQGPSGATEPIGKLGGEAA